MPPEPGRGLLGIAIVNFRGAGDTGELVRSIVARNAERPAPVAVAIVDNSDEAADLEPVVAYAREHGLGCHLIHGHGNVGYAAGNNLAAAWLLDAGATVVWVLNPDTRVVAGSLGALLAVEGIGATMAAAPDGPPRPGTGAINLWTGRSGDGRSTPAPGGPNNHAPGGPNNHAPGGPNNRAPGGPNNRAPGGRSTLTYVAGHSLVLGRAAWEELGGLSERYFLFFEEADLAVRGGRLAIPTTAVTDVVVAHAGGAATGTTTDLRGKSATAYFHASRSCVIFFRRHHPRRLPVVVAARLGYAAKVLGVAGSGKATAVVRGVLAGLRA